MQLLVYCRVVDVCIRNFVDANEYLDVLLVCLLVGERVSDAYALMVFDLMWTDTRKLSDTIRATALRTSTVHTGTILTYRFGRQFCIVRDASYRCRLHS
jgi:hypothetical protein